MPTLDPNKASAFVSFIPDDTSKNGTAMAISELVTLLPARERVIGVEHLISGKICPLGEYSLPFARTKHTKTQAILTKQPIDKLIAVA